MIVYRHGNTLMIDYTPDSAVNAGDVVVVGSECRIAHQDIDAGELGAVAAPSGTAVYEGPKQTGIGTGFDDGDPVYWDATAKVCTNTNAAGENVRIGTAVAAADDNSQNVLFRHHSADPAPAEGSGGE